MRETKLNSYNLVLEENIVKCPKGVLIISEQDHKYIFNKIPFVQSQTVIFPELCITIFFHHINPSQPACIFHRIKVTLFNQVLFTHNFTHTISVFISLS